MKASVPRMVTTPVNSWVKPISRPSANWSDVGDDAADDLAVGVAVQIGQGQHLDFVEGLRRGYRAPTR